MQHINFTKKIAVSVLLVSAITAASASVAFTSTQTAEQVVVEENNSASTGAATDETKPKKEEKMAKTEVKAKKITGTCNTIEAEIKTVSIDYSSTDDTGEASTDTSLSESSVETLVAEEVTKVSPVDETPVTISEPIKITTQTELISIGHEDICLYPEDQEPSNINARIACNYINGKIVAPGEVFSYSDALEGDTTPEKGYVPAHIIGGTGTGYGGGICKISSALYQAVLHTGWNKKDCIVERHPHSKPVAYYQEGQDAAIAYP